MSDQGERLESIVLFLSAPKELDAKRLAEVLSDVIGRPVPAIDPDTPSPNTERNKPVGPAYVAAALPNHFFVCVDEVAYFVHNVAAPYMEDPKQAGAKIHEMRIRKAILDHKAWLSMDVLNSEQASPDAYRIILGVLARLSDPGCLAVYHPATNRFAFSLSDKEAARGAPDPIAALFEMEKMLPVTAVGEDRRLKAAEDEARRRFPEFELAFRTKAGGSFSVKTLLSGNGNSEHIWVMVQDIAGGRIKGTLGNDPVGLGDWKFGVPVEIAVSDVEDWVFVERRFLRKPRTVGCFTLPVLAEIERERLAAG